MNKYTLCPTYASHGLASKEYRENKINKTEINGMQIGPPSI